MSEPRLYPGTGPDERTHFTPYGAFEVPADLRQLHGRFDVEATARRIRNFRFAEEWIMLTLGGWLATIPEVPVKTGLGKIIWESAQAADAEGVTAGVWADLTAWCGDESHHDDMTLLVLRVARDTG